MQLNENEVMIGETVRLSILIKNKTNENQAMTVAIIGLPAGLSLQPWQLKQLLDENKFDFYELKGNRLVLYYRGMAANDVKRIDLDLKADIAGTVGTTRQNLQTEYTKRLASALDSDRYDNMSKAMALYELNRIDQMARNMAGNTLTKAHKTQLRQIVKDAKED